MQDDLRRRIQQLPEDQRRLIERYHLEHQPYAEIARLIGASEGTPSTLDRAAGPALKRLIADGDHDGDQQE